MLKSDTKREKLLLEERKIQEQIADPDLTEKQKADNLARLDQLYSEIASAQLDNAPARASTILFGLGFKPDHQKRPTR